MSAEPAWLRLLPQPDDPGDDAAWDELEADIPRMLTPLADRRARIIAAAVTLASSGFGRIGWVKYHDGKGPRRPGWQHDATADPETTTTPALGAARLTGRGTSISGGRLLPGPRSLPRCRASTSMRFCEHPATFAHGRDRATEGDDD